MLARSSMMRVQRQALQSAHIPAPIGGVNTVAPALAMPEGDCVYAYNLIASQYGFRSRLGFKEWCTGLTGAADLTVRTMIPFVASAVANTRLFATTSSGIWDVTSSSPAPTMVLTFGVQTDSAGVGVSTVFSTPADRFCLYADEENGLFICPESTTTWVAAVNGVAAFWEPNTAVTVGVKVINGPNIYVVTVAGITAASGGPTGVGPGIVDGTATWNFVSASIPKVIGPSLADQVAGLTLDVADVAFVMSWKSRLWLIPKHGTLAWYLDVNSVYGEATSFDFGTKMRVGGQLIGLYDWSYDGGSGIDSRLVGLSGAGDVVIYAGTDPNSAETFGLVGAWSVGAVPAGRHIATPFGGDLLVLSALGLTSLSKLVTGKVTAGTQEKTQYETAKISNYFAQLVASFGSQLGWAVHIHPTDNALLLLVPQGDLSVPTIQLAAAFISHGWTQYRDIPMSSACVFEGQMYFGTNDGRVCLNAGYVDGVQLADASAWTPVSWSILTAYTNLGDARQKQVKLIQLDLMADGARPLVEPIAKYNLDTMEPAPPSGSPFNAGDSLWDSATWDSSVWGGELTPYVLLFGATGLGRSFAISIRGSAVARTVLAGVDVFVEVGGLL